METNVPHDDRGPIEPLDEGFRAAALAYVNEPIRPASQAHLRIMAPDLEDPTPVAEPPCCGGAGIVDLGSVSVPCPEPACGWCACGEYVGADYPAHTCAWAVSAR
ncbi:MAG TPA: hypothetical protein VFR67_21045 [Pilimelia sp.]|nr:hypothetical protein [Pilimelia sp.]